MKKMLLTMLSITMLSIFMVNQVFCKDYDAYIGIKSFPLEISGFKSAYLNDYLVSGEGPGSETVYVDYASINSAGTNTSWNLGGNYYFQPTHSVPIDLFGISGPVEGSGFGIGYNYHMFELIENLDLSFGPKFGSISAEKTLTYLPYFAGQINVSEGDFNTGDKVTAKVSGSYYSIETKVKYYIKDNHGLFFNLGFMSSSLTPIIEIGDKEIGSPDKIHSSTCTGSSSVNLSCSNYLDPFSNVEVKAGGISFGLGYMYKK